MFRRNLTSKAFLYFSRKFNAAIELPINILGRLILSLSGVKCKSNLNLHGLPIVSLASDSAIEIGANCRFRSRSYGNAIGINHPVVLRTLAKGAVLRIGDNVGMSGGAICAAGAVIIGNRVTIGANTTISDSDFHSQDPQLRAAGGDFLEFREVVIEDDVWLGADVYVCKGVTIGHSSIIGAKSVVTRDVQPNSIVAGNPARLIRKL